MIKKKIEDGRKLEKEMKVATLMKILGEKEHIELV